MRQAVPYLTRLSSKVCLPNLGQTELFPPRPTSVSELREICIGTKSRALGDALVLTPLVRQLKERHPKLKIRFYNRGFNAVVFYGNPAIAGPDFFPGAVYGDDANSGEGHLVQQKQRFFHLQISEDPKPELYLTESEKNWARSWVKERSGDSSQPICVLHPSGKTFSNVVDHEFWVQTVARWRGKIRFWQLGLQGQIPIAGCDQYLLGPRDPWHLRKDMALMNEARFFLGIDSGPMHLARAFSIPSLVLTKAGPLSEIFERRRKFPYYLHDNWKNSFLYETNTNVSVAQASAGELRAKVDEFFERWSTK